MVRQNQAIIDTMSDIFLEASEGAEETPGAMTSTVRAFASVLIDSLNSTNSSSVDLDTYQVCLERLCVRMEVSWRSADGWVTTCACACGNHII